VATKKVDPPQVGPSDAALVAFEKSFSASFGEKALRRLNDPVERQVIPSGSLALDYAMGTGGYLRGRLTELVGPWSTGKTTMSIMAIAEAQRRYPQEMAGFVDMEHTFDPTWATAHGVDINRLYLVQPGTAEEVADAMRFMTETGYFSILVLDSIGAMIPKAEITRDAEEELVGRYAKIITRMVKISTVQSHEHNVAILLINQLRAVIGANMPGAKKTTKPGGFALQHVTSHVLDFRKSEAPIYQGTGDDKVEVAQQIAIQVVKNKLAPPKKTATILLKHMSTEKYGPLGIDTFEETFELGRRLRIGVVQDGAWYTLPDQTKHQGADKARAHLAQHPEFLPGIRNDIIEAIAHQIAPTAAAEG
jgi:recombination protein RecA